MSAATPLTERRAHLGRKLGAIARLVGHLEFSRQRLPYPLASVDALDELELESVSALIERFGKLQDLLGGTFREMTVLSGEDASDMNDVLAASKRSASSPRPTTGAACVPCAISARTITTTTTPPRPHSSTNPRVRRQS